MTKKNDLDIVEDSYVPEIYAPTEDECSPIESSLILQEIQERFQQNPVAFCKYILGVGLWHKQADIMMSVALNRLTTIVACNGAGKTFTLSCLLLWYSIAFYPAVVIVISPTFKQTKEQLFGTVNNIYNNSKIALGGNMGLVRLSFSPIAYALGIAIGEGESRVDNIQGFHADSGNILIMLDEASGFQPAVFSSVRGSTNTENARLLLSGNPMRAEGDFYQSFSNKGYNKIHIPLQSTPNYRANKEIIKGISGRQFEKDIIEQYGKESHEYKVRVLAEFDEEIGETFITRKMIKDVLSRKKPLYPQKQQGGVLADLLFNPRPILAVDVAGFGKDRSVIFLRQGLIGHILDVIPQNTEGALAGRIVDRMFETEQATGQMPIVMIDAGGAGNAIPHIIIERYPDLTPYIRKVNSGDKPSIYGEEFFNIRAEAFYYFKQWCRYGMIKNDNKTKRVNKDLDIEVSSFGSTYNNGRLVIERKEQIKKRTKMSPDRADAIMFSFTPIKYL